MSDRRDDLAQVVGTDLATDIAVLQVDSPGISEIELGNSDETMVGDFVVAIGNPFGIGRTVTSGIVSALGRSGINPEGYEDFIQTDASVNPGNSGGALITLDGKLVFINCAITAHAGGNVGIGFAVPINMAKGVMGQIITYRETEGVAMHSVEPASSVSRASLRTGDIVTAVNNEPFQNVEELISNLPDQGPVALSVYRNGSLIYMVIP